MAKTADLTRTAGNRIGATMLFHNHSGEDDFGADEAVYNEVYNIGYRAVQIQPGDKSENWLDGCKQWAAEREEETHVHTIDFLVNTGDKPACPASEDKAVRQRAREITTLHLTNAVRVGSLSHFGPYFSGLLAGYYPWSLSHDARVVEYLIWLNGVVEGLKITFEAEVLNRFEAAVSKLAHGARLLEEAKTGDYMTLGPDTFHQNEGEPSTVEAWKAHENLFGETGHLSDNGRYVIGAQQALTATEVFPYLASGQSSITTWNVEAFGKDVNPGIAAALCIRVPEELDGIDVMRNSFARIVDEFASIS